jgi:Cu2+-exporting ATPase
MKKVTLKVEGMECHGCENRIINALKNSKLAENVTANFETGVVEIEAKDDMDLNQIKEKIDDLGFSVINK